MRKRTINLLLALGVFAGVAAIARPPGTVEAARDFGPRPQARLITSLVGQTQTINVWSTAHGVRYSVTIDGQTLLADATLDELKRKQPEAFRQIQSSIADTSTEPTWAGVDTIDAMDR